MLEHQVIGIIVIVFIPLVGIVIGIMKPIITLNSTLVALDKSIEQMQKESIKVCQVLDDHTKKLNEHENALIRMGGI